MQLDPPCKLFQILDEEIPAFLQAKSVIEDWEEKKYQYSKGIVMQLKVDAAIYDTEMIYERSALFNDFKPLNMNKGDEIEFEG